MGSPKVIEDENTITKSVFRLTKTGLKIHIRPAELSDKFSVKEFLDALSIQSLYRRFFSLRKNMREEFLRDFFLPGKNEMKLLALSDNNNSVVTGIGQYYVHPGTCLGEIALVVSDVNQNRGLAGYY